MLSESLKTFEIIDQTRGSHVDKQQCVRPRYTLPTLGDMINVVYVTLR